MTFDLVLASDGAVLATATTPGELDFRAAYPYVRWGVITRQAAMDGTYYTNCVARVDLNGAKDYRKAADHAMRVVRDWLVAGHATDDFDIRDYLADGPIIEVNFKGGDDDD